MEGQPGSPVLGFLQHQTAPARVTVIFIGFPSSNSTSTINAPDLASTFPARRIVVEVPVATKASYTIDDFLSHIKSTHLAADHGIHLDSVLYCGPPGFSIVTRQQSVSVLRDGEYLIVAACGAPVSSVFTSTQIGENDASKSRGVILDSVDPKKSPGRRHVHHHVVHKHTCCQQRDGTETVFTPSPNGPAPAHTHTRHLQHQPSTSHHHSSHKARPLSPSGSSVDLASVTSSADSRQRRRASRHNHHHDYGGGTSDHRHNHRSIRESMKRTNRSGGGYHSDEERNGDDLNRTVAKLLRDESIQDLLKNVLQSLATKLGSSPPRKEKKAAESVNQSESDDEEAVTPSAFKMRAAARVKKSEKSTTQSPWPELDKQDPGSSNSKGKKNDAQTESNRILTQELNFVCADLF
ncbi:hypothetical protein BJ742DRAFT_483165 [Cladochytrium replicatum]|nr:hypothetical protein BJ742DRAFT_483165 [Cladochytrium replicatum]